MGKIRNGERDSGLVSEDGSICPSELGELTQFQRETIECYKSGINSCNTHLELIEFGRSVAELPDCKWLKEAIRPHYRKRQEALNGKAGGTGPAAST